MTTSSYILGSTLGAFTPAPSCADTLRLESLDELVESGPGRRPQLRDNALRHQGRVAGETKMWSLLLLNVVDARFLPHVTAGVP